MEPVSRSYDLPSNLWGRKLDPLVIPTWEMGSVGTGESKWQKYPRIKWERGWKDWPRVGSMQVREAGETRRLQWWWSVRDPLGVREMWGSVCKETVACDEVHTGRQCLGGKPRKELSDPESSRVRSCVWRWRWALVFQLDSTSVTAALFLTRRALHGDVLVRILDECLGVKVSACYRLIEQKWQYWGLLPL